MRWATCREADGTESTGLVDGDELVVPPTAVSLLDLLRDDRLSDAAAEAETSGRRVHLPDVELLAPIPRPPSVRDFAAFEEHLRNGNGGDPPPAEWYEIPAFYFSNPAAVVGPHDDVAVPPGSRAFDYELEVAAVIGRSGSDLDVADAERHIAGYAVLCDFSARDLQAKESTLGLGPSKGKDSATSLGPFLVTPEELEEHRVGRSLDLKMRASVNGRQYSSGCLSSMYWSFAELVAYASRGTTVLPGDVIGSGTVGTGCILEHRMMGARADHPWLQPGDVVEIEVEALGTLTHHVVPGPEPRSLR